MKLMTDARTLPHMSTDNTHLWCSTSCIASNLCTKRRISNVLCLYAQRQHYQSVRVGSVGHNKRLCGRRLHSCQDLTSETLRRLFWKRCYAIRRNTVNLFPSRLLRKCLCIDLHLDRAEQHCLSEVRFSWRFFVIVRSAFASHNDATGDTSTGARHCTCLKRFQHWKSNPGLANASLCLNH